MIRISVLSSAFMAMAMMVTVASARTGSNTGNGLVEGPLHRIELNGRLWTCADAELNPDIFHEELARQNPGDTKVRKFMEQCLKWGDGWRFKKSSFGSIFETKTGSLPVSEGNSLVDRHQLLQRYLVLRRLAASAASNVYDYDGRSQ